MACGSDIGFLYFKRRMNVLLLLSFAFISHINAQVELIFTSTKADSLAYYESIGGYKTILSQKLFDPSLNKKIPDFCQNEIA